MPVTILKANIHNL